MHSPPLHNTRAAPRSLSFPLKLPGGRRRPPLALSDGPPSCPFPADPSRRGSSGKGQTSARLAPLAPSFTSRSALSCPPFPYLRHGHAGAHLFNQPGELRDDLLLELLRHGAAGERLLEEAAARRLHALFKAVVAVRSARAALGGRLSARRHGPRWAAGGRRRKRRRRGEGWARGRRESSCCCGRVLGVFLALGLRRCTAVEGTTSMDGMLVSECRKPGEKGSMLAKKRRESDRSSATMRQGLEIEICSAPMKPVRPQWGYGSAGADFTRGVRIDRKKRRREKERKSGRKLLLLSFVFFPPCLLVAPFPPSGASFGCSERQTLCLAFAGLCANHIKRNARREEENGGTFPPAIWYTHTPLLSLLLLRRALSPSRGGAPSCRQHRAYKVCTAFRFFPPLCRIARRRRKPSC